MEPATNDYIDALRVITYGVPFESCHCFDAGTKLCQFCMMSLDTYVESDHTVTCHRHMQPMVEYHNYIYAVVKARSRK